MTTRSDCTSVPSELTIRAQAEAERARYVTALLCGLRRRIASRFAPHGLHGLPS